LLGYQEAAVLLHNPIKDSLYLVCLDEDGDKMYKSKFPPGDEVDFKISKD
jgi:hypothetical protein